MRNVIFKYVFNNHDQCFGLDNTGLGLEENWPWPQRLMAFLASNMLSSRLEPIPVTFFSNARATNNIMEVIHH